MWKFPQHTNTHTHTHKCHTCMCLHMNIDNNAHETPKWSGTGIRISLPPSHFSIARFFACNFFAAKLFYSCFIAFVLVVALILTPLCFRLLSSFGVSFCYGFHYLYAFNLHLPLSVSPSLFRCLYFTLSTAFTNSHIAHTVAFLFPLAIRSYLLLFYDYCLPALPDYALRASATVWP